MRFLPCKFLVVLALLCPLATAQMPAAPTLRQITARAAYIFSGTVTAVDRAPITESNEVETIRITFRVDQAVRGVRSRQAFTIREWAGLWNAGPRYQVGEQVVLALYPRSKLGLTSPVGGSLGRFALDRTGELTLPPQQSETLASDPVAGPWLRGRSHVSGHDLARILRRVAKE